MFLISLLKHLFPYDFNSKVLETCVKNCGKRFHIQMATKDFLGELIKIIGPKNDPPQIVQEKILSLIQVGPTERVSPNPKKAKLLEYF